MIMMTMMTTQTTTTTPTTTSDDIDDGDDDDNDDDDDADDDDDEQHCLCSDVRAVPRLQQRHVFDVDRVNIGNVSHVTRSVCRDIRNVQRQH